MLRRVCAGSVVHTVKVTYLGKGKYGCRVFVNGILNQEQIAEGKDQIGPVCRELLRWEDKCGNISEFASAARTRGYKR